MDNSHIVPCLFQWYLESFQQTQGKILVREDSNLKWMTDELRTSIAREICVIEARLCTPSSPVEDHQQSLMVTASFHAGATGQTRKPKCIFFKNEHSATQRDIISDQPKWMEVVKKDKLCCDCPGHPKVAQCQSKGRYVSGPGTATSSKSKSWHMWKLLDWKTFHFWQLQGSASYGKFYYQMPYKCTAFHIWWSYNAAKNGYISHSFPAYPDMAKLAQCFYSTPYYVSLWVWFPFFENLDIGFLWYIIILSSGKLEKMWVFIKFGKYSEKTQSHYESWYIEV